MYHSIQEFLEDWHEEHELTLKLFRQLSDASLTQQVSKECRTLGQLAWHIVTSLGEIAGKAGLVVTAPESGSPVPSTAKEILSAYEKAAETFILAIKEQWSDILLLETIEMYDEHWTRSATLSSIIKHLIHHRAQMTVIMRQLGLKVPGIYGPSREEWTELGLEPAE